MNDFIVLHTWENGDTLAIRKSDVKKIKADFKNDVEISKIITYSEEEYLVYESVHLIVAMLETNEKEL